MNLYNVRKELNMGIPLTTMNLKVTDYSRVSTDHAEQQNSLKNQIEHFDEMIKNNKNWTYVNGYVDRGISGTTDYKRDNFMKMIEDAKNGKFDLIITKEISRFSRNTLDSIKYTRELLSYGVAVLFVNDNINTALPDSELRLTIMASLAQDEIRRLSERVKFGMKQAIKKGTILGNNMLYGYRKDKNSGCLYIVRDEALIVERLFNMYVLEKQSLSKIAKIFNNEGIKTIQNKKWCVSTLMRMIKNPKYKGYYRGHTTEIIDYMTKKVHNIPLDKQVIYDMQDKIPPIISDEIWERANKRLKDRGKKFSKNINEKVEYRNKYPLSSKIYCANCHEIFFRRKQLKMLNDITWCCGNYYKKGKDFCNSPNLRESEIIYIFNDIINYLGINLNELSNLVVSIYQNNKECINCDNKLEELIKKQYLINIKKDKLLELNIEGNLTNNEFNKRNIECNLELEKIANEKKQLESKEGENNDNTIERIVNEKIASFDIITELINLLIDQIIVSKINNNQYNYELKFYLNINQSLFKIDNNYLKDFKFYRGGNSKNTKKYYAYYHVLVDNSK